MLFNYIMRTIIFILFAIITWYYNSIRIYFKQIDGKPVDGCFENSYLESTSNGFIIINVYNV